eukprot:gnl/TRDRNA2_/TRDRNA2_75384_c0_seq1.p1 gnl/TRDRNA2_/TRDRNA2_75384_c0~~gnl/TRDRNA2_/TRDRNA2_75384_c0_seq1.p1  ORF type:complete len:168 (+),score=16.98 gnl/TRDRNA2_/TRDRNA2_75384_c0_seq1:114-617(+)
MQALEQEDPGIQRRTSLRLRVFSVMTIIYALQVVSSIFSWAVGSADQLVLRLASLLAISYFMIEICCFKVEAGDTTICRAYPMYSCVVTVCFVALLFDVSVMFLAEFSMVSLIRLMRLFRLFHIALLGFLLFVNWQRWKKHRQKRELSAAGMPTNLGSGYIAMPGFD